MTTKQKSKRVVIPQGLGRSLDSNGSTIIRPHIKANDNVLSTQNYTDGLFTDTSDDITETPNKEVLETEDEVFQKKHEFEMATPFNDEDGTFKEDDFI